MIVKIRGGCFTFFSLTEESAVGVVSDAVADSPRSWRKEQLM